MPNPAKELILTPLLPDRLHGCSDARVGMPEHLCRRRRILLEVIDSGPGVPDEIAPRIFDRYVHRDQAPLLTGSVGLGLSIARLLVEGMGGKLTYARVKDLSIFELRLALISVAQPDAPTSLVVAV
jgi:K+-sensing histidine kinase KdpD